MAKAMKVKKKKIIFYGKKFVEPSITDVIHLEEGDLPKGDVTPHKPI